MLVEDHEQTEVTTGKNPTFGVSGAFPEEVAVFCRDDGIVFCVHNKRFVMRESGGKVIGITRKLVEIFSSDFS